MSDLGWALPGARRIEYGYAPPLRQRARGAVASTPTPGSWMMTRADRKTRIVMKFGGTSVADVERIKAVAARVKRELDAGHEVAVVVSAMAGVTNQLVAWTSD